MIVGLDSEVNVEKSSVLNFLVEGFSIALGNIFFEDRSIGINCKLDQRYFTGFDEFTFNDPRDRTEKFMKIL